LKISIEKYVIITLSKTSYESSFFASEIEEWLVIDDIKRVDLIVELI